MLLALNHFLDREDGAVTVDWVVLSAAVVGLLAAGYGTMRDATTNLADSTESYMATAEPGSF